MKNINWSSEAKTAFAVLGTPNPWYGLSAILFASGFVLLGMFLQPHEYQTIHAPNGALEYIHHTPQGDVVIK